MNPELHPQHKTLILTIIVVGVVALFAVVMYILLFSSSQPIEEPVLPPQPMPERRPEGPSEEELEFSEFPDTAVEVAPPEQVTNPVEDLPQSNPFEANTNPFEEAYKNPFE